MSRGRTLLLARQGREYPESGCRISASSMSRTQNQPGMRVPWDGFQDLVRLFYSESGVPLQQSCSMRKRNIERSNGLRNAVQLNIQSLPRGCYELIRISHGRFVKCATAVGEQLIDRLRAAMTFHLIA
jgi:hypothetical protein